MNIEIEDRIHAGTLLAESRSECSDAALKIGKMYDEIVILAKYCEILEDDGHPVTHIGICKAGKCIDIPISEARRIAEHYAGKM